MAVSVVDPDSILVQEHLGGEREAFDVLYRRYFPRLVRLCTRLTKDSAAAEDITQETLVRAHEHLARFDLSRPMWPWLKTIAQRLLIDHVRANGREMPTDEGPVELGHDDPSWTEEREVLAQALSKLPPRQRTAVALRYIEDWDGTQAAEFLGLSGLAFRQILHRARRKLQTEYRKIADPVMGAILLPLGWLRRAAHESALRLRTVTTSPDALKALGVVTAANLVVATAAVFGGEGGGAPPSAVQPAPPNPRSSQIAGHMDRAGSVQPAPDAVSPDVRVSATGDETPPAAGSERSDIAGQAGDRGHDVADGIVNPNGDVTQPEDAEVLSVAFSPRFATDETVYAAGRAVCTTPQCPPVLFRSTDGGASWARLPAEGFDGVELLLPPAYGSDPRIFSAGPLGLEVSEDGGDSFAPAAPGFSGSTGSAAISPGFNSGDPIILIGDQALMQYRDDIKTVGPSRPILGRGPLHPAFSPTFQQDGMILVGGVQVLDGGWVGSVFRCVGEVCSGAPLPLPTGEPPKVVVSPDLAEEGLAYAFTANGLFASRDQGGSFSPVTLPFRLPVNAVAAGSDARLYVSTRAPSTGGLGGIYISSDGGLTWTHAESPLLSNGVTGVWTAGDHVLAALHFGGIACSADGGTTWAARCPAA